MMTESDFCNKTNGKPWINRAEGPNAYDCWGLVLASFREVDGIELPQVSGYVDENCSTEEAAKGADKLACYQPSQPCNRAIMAIFNTKGEITHVGRCLAGRVLHATSTLGVRWDTYRAITKKYPDARYFMYKG